MTALAALGLTGPEADVYVQLCHVRSSSTAELVLALGLPEATVARALELLDARGVIRPSRRGGRFSAVAPDVALESRLAERQAELRATREVVDHLMEVFRSRSFGRRPADIVEPLESNREIRLAFESMQRGASRELVGFIKAPVIEPITDNPTERELLTKGIGFRGIYERSLLDEDGAYATLLASAADGEEVRIATTLPLKMIIADGRLALVTVDSDSSGTEVGALLVHASSLVLALVALFEATWALSSSVPSVPGAVAAEGTAQLSDDSRKVVSLLLAGMTDQSVAAQLGWSLRKVQHHVRQLMELTGAGSRMQLGWQLARRGWE